MRTKTKYLSKSDVMHNFKIIDGDIYRRLKKGSWRIINNGGCDNGDGYKQTTLKGKFYQVHRIVWIYFNDAIDEGLYVDHIDGDRTNNNINNLRLLTHIENVRDSALGRFRREGWSGTKCLNYTHKGDSVYIGYFGFDEYYKLKDKIHRLKHLYDGDKQKFKQLIIEP